MQLHIPALKKHLFILVLVASMLPHLSKAASVADADTMSTYLMEQVKRYFNSDDEKAFYVAAGNYREYFLQKSNLPNYYLGWEHEILYDVNHNHFYRAMRKTMFIQNDMRHRKAEKEYYKATHLRGIIYSLRGNIPLARQYFEKALEQVDHSQPTNLVGLYMDLANIEMDTEPREALKHLDCALEIIRASRGGYEYSDAIGFKVIIAYAMRDWPLVKKTFREYMQLKDKIGSDFSYTYYNYVVICNDVANGNYDDAIQQTLQLTNSTDIYKFQTEIYELSGNIEKAFAMQKNWMAVKDSVNNLIMSEEMIGSASDLEDALMRNEACSKRNENTQLVMVVVVLVVALVGFLACRFHKRKYMKTLSKQNHDLSIARDKAMEADRMKISFLQNISHEIRTPLNVISGYAQVLGDPMTQLSDEDRTEMASRITRSTTNIVHIVDEILDVSAKESIHFVDKNDFVSCNELVRDVMQFYDGQKGSLELTFETTLKDSHKMMTNAKEVKKILGHLLNNAVKFTSAGSVAVRCYEDTLENTICFSVTDTGKGVKEGEEEKIFEHFYKVDAYKEGVGLGLPLSRRIARQLGGDVVLDSAYRTGSRFILKLPVE